MKLDNLLLRVAFVSLCMYIVSIQYAQAVTPIASQLASATAKSLLRIAVQETIKIAFGYISESESLNDLENQFKRIRGQITEEKQRGEITYEEADKLNNQLLALSGLVDEVRLRSSPMQYIEVGYVTDFIRKNIHGKKFEYVHIETKFPMSMEGRFYIKTHRGHFAQLKIENRSGWDSMSAFLPNGVSSNEVSIGSSVYIARR